MGIKVKRRTGFMGAASRITLVVDGVAEKKMRNNEEVKIDSDKDKVKLKVRQMYFGSNELTAQENDRIEIKTNTTCLLLFVVSMILIMTSMFLEYIPIKTIFSLIGLVGMLVTIILSIKSWFVLSKIT